MPGGDCLSAEQTGALAYEVADLCRENLRLKPVFSLIDRRLLPPCRENLRPVFARNIAQAISEGGHFLLIAWTFQDARIINPRATPSEEGLRDHVEEIFGNYFVIERAEATFLNAREDHESMPAMVLDGPQTKAMYVLTNTAGLSWRLAASRVLAGCMDPNVFFLTGKKQFCYPSIGFEDGSVFEPHNGHPPVHRNQTRSEICISQQTKRY